jgi:hypothetical protein
MIKYTLVFSYDSRAKGVFDGFIKRVIIQGLKRLQIQDLYWHDYSGESVCEFDVVFSNGNERKHFEKGINNLLKAQRLIARKVKSKYKVVDDGK